MKTAAVLSTFLAAAAANPLRVRNFFHNKVENEHSSTTTTSMVHVPSGGYSQQSDSVSHHQHHDVAHPTGTGYRTGAARPTGTGYRTGAASPTGVSTSSGNGTSQGTSNYKQFTGDGSTAAGWPAMSDWVSDFDSLWDINKNTISISCGYVQTTYDSAIVNPSDNEMSQIKDAIKSVSDASKFDPRFVLAIMMQETSGCPRIYNTTSPGTTPVNNPGLLQDHNGVHSCNTGVLDTTTMKYTKGKVQNPCPQDQINGMVDDGVNGTPSGPGLLSSVDSGKKQGSGDAQAYYIGARLYNSGPSSYNGQDLGAPGATRCYSSDVANRLIGFNGPKSGCTLGQPQPSSS